ncbi:MAG: DEAD/DEAH box helicase [Candidatus Omnitrophota bacterium]|nr:DEAD/DEAH box helicase [Candidatus Omnitrophota bacterium]
MNKPHNHHTQEPAAESGGSFFGLGIAPKILEILERIKFVTPTPIQVKAIPLAIQGQDVIGIAQTGTGKTHAFAIPMVQRLAQNEGMAIILAPTRELALQIDEAVRMIAHAFGMKTACLIGGAPMHPQVEALRRRPRIIIATPGRFIDHMENHLIQMPRVNMLVLDEADRMLDMGFAPQVEKILRVTPKDRQTMLFSATMPGEIIRMVNAHMKLPTHVEIARSGTTADHITQELYIVKRESKLKLLGKVLSQYRGTVLLFIRTKHSAHKIVREVRAMGHRVAEIHSDKSLSQRREALEGFKSGKYRILVATDIASRGIDVTRIELVLNYDLPDDVSNYVHRIGRTGRAGCAGHAISFATPDQSSDVTSIEQMIQMQLPIVRHPDIQTEEFVRPQKPAQAAPRPRDPRAGRGRRRDFRHFRRR